MTTSHQTHDMPPGYTRAETLARIRALRARRRAIAGHINAARSVDLKIREQQKVLAIVRYWHGETAPHLARLLDL